MSDLNMFKMFTDALADNPPIVRPATNLEAGKVLADQIKQVEHIQEHINDLLEEMQDIAAEMNRQSQSP